jgi:hypothetical protein
MSRMLQMMQQQQHARSARLRYFAQRPSGSA